MKKLIGKIHLWLSVPVGLVITIICLTGAILVFETELTELFNRETYFVKEVKEQKLPLNDFIVKVNSQLPDSLSVASVQLTQNPKRNYRIGLKGANRMSAYADPYTGELKDISGYSSGFFSVMRRMHRWLMDTYKRDGVFVGKTVVGVSTLIFVVILITGVIVWIPKTKKAFKKSLAINLKEGKKRFWHDLHVAGGVYVVIVLLVLSLTGLTWSFTWYRNAFYKVFGAEIQNVQPRPQPQTSTANAQQGQTPAGNRGENPNAERGNRGNENAGREEKPEKQKGINTVVWQNVINNLTTQNPDFKSITIQDGRVSLQTSNYGNSRGADSYSFDKNTGEITEVKLYKDQDKSSKMRGWIYAVHVGSWGGIFTKIITFLAALMGASLPITGYYLWIVKGINKRRYKKQQKALLKSM